MTRDAGETYTVAMVEHKASPHDTEGREPREEDRVRLPQLLGVRPGVYLTVLYGLMLVGILFFIFLYPGIADPGRVVTLVSEPLGAAVRLDGVTRGTTPCKLFIPRENRVIEMVLPGFHPWRFEGEIPARLIGSRFFPQREPIGGTLKAEDPQKVLALAAADYAAWTFTGEPTLSYQIPLSLSEGAYRAGPAGTDGEIRSALEETLKGAFRFAVTRAAVKDLIRSRFLIDNGGLAPSLFTAISSIHAILEHLDQVPGSAFWLQDVLPPEAAARIAGSSWYAQSAENLALSFGPLESSRGSAASLDLGALRFRAFRRGETGASPQDPERMAGWIAETPLSWAVWDDFIQARPEWGRENFDALIEAGWVTGEYLQRFESTDGDAPVSGISWYAAAAFCRWLSEQLPPAWADYEVRLPREEEWVYARPVLDTGAQQTAGEGRRTGLFPEGNYWEWCEDPYAPLNTFPAGLAVIRAISSPERSLVSLGAAGRASLPPASCSPVVSFRPLIAVRESQGALP